MTTNEQNTAWGVALTAVHCPNCGATHLVPGDTRLSVCPACLQGRVTVQPVPLDELTPELVVSSRLLPAALRRALGRWVAGGRLRPGDMTLELLARRLRRYYFPLWLVDGRVEGSWQADVGFNYQVVSYEDRFQENVGWHSHKMKETRVRWEPRVGRMKRSYDNLTVPALDDHRVWARRLGAYDLEQRSEYAPEMLQKSVVRLPTLTPDEAWPEAESAFFRAVAADIGRAAAADHVRDLALDAEYSELNWTLLLLPAYVTWYREGERVWPVLINGQSGRIYGVRRVSARRANIISLALGAAALFLFAVGGMVALLSAVFAPAALLGGLGIVGGVLLAFAAPVPAIWAWRQNRRGSDL